MANDERFSSYMALDGPHLDGLIGSAGVLRFDWPEKKTYIQHFEGISAAHNVSIAHNGQLALLGNFSQQIVLLDISDPKNMRMVARQSTMYFEECAYRLRSNTHHLWYPDNHLYIASGGSHAVVDIPLDTFDKARVVRTMPSALNRFLQWPKRGRNVLGAFSRKSVPSSTHFVLQTLQVTGGRLADGVYSTRVSPGGGYVVAGSRGYNYLAVFRRDTMKKIYGKVLPFRRDVYGKSPHYRFGWRGHHLGIHHSEIVGR